MEIIQKAKRLNPESAERILIKGDVEVSLEAAKEVLMDCFVKPSTIAKLQGKWWGGDLLDRNLDAELLVPEDDDIPLAERVKRINAHCLALCKKNVIVVSNHVNSAGNGTKWLNATGWSVFTCSGQTESDKLAECLCEAAIKNFSGRRIRTDFSDGDSDWEEQFYILRKSRCPAVLTENFFMDNHSDLEYLQSRAGKQIVVDTHVEGIMEYLTTRPA